MKGATAESDELDYSFSRGGDDKWLVVLSAAFAYFAVGSFVYEPGQDARVDDEPDFQSRHQPGARIKLG
jgi:hypothetical protein